MPASAVPHSVQPFVVTTTGQTLTLREEAAQVAVYATVGGGSSVTSIVGGVTSATGTGTFAQFSGTAETPSKTVGLGPGFIPNSMVIVDYVPWSKLNTDA